MVEVNRTECRSCGNEFYFDVTVGRVPRKCAACRPCGGRHAFVLFTDEGGPDGVPTCAKCGKEGTA